MRIGSDPDPYPICNTFGSTTLFKTDTGPYRTGNQLENRLVKSAELALHFSTLQRHRVIPVPTVLNNVSHVTVDLQPFYASLPFCTKSNHFSTASYKISQRHKFSHVKRQRLESRVSVILFLRNSN